MSEEKNAPDGAKAEVREDAPTEIKMPSDAFKARLEESKGAGRKELFKKLGVASEAELERQLKAGKDLEEASLSEKERTAKQLAELAPKAQRAEALEKRFAANVQKRIDALPEDERDLVEQFGGESAELRDAFLDAREAILAKQAARNGAKPPAPARTAPAPKAPAPAAASTKFDEWNQLQSKNPMLADLFYNANRAEIERDRPKD